MIGTVIWRLRYAWGNRCLLCVFRPYHGEEPFPPGGVFHTGDTVPPLVRIRGPMLIATPEQVSKLGRFGQARVVIGADAVAKTLYEIGEEFDRRERDR